VEGFDPQAVVLQCGADTICGDLIGNLHVSTHAFAECVHDVLQLGLPTVMLGGGGYHVLHTAKCWAVQTAVALGVYEQLPVYIPKHDPYYKEFRREHPPKQPTVHVFPLLRETQAGPKEHLISLRLQSFFLHLATQMANVRRARGLLRVSEMPSVPDAEKTEYKVQGDHTREL
jgi:hypothetical protein